MVRFGIVGFGLHAVKRLMPGFANARNCRVTALSRRDPERARESAREFGIEHAFTSTAELCASPDVDAVFIATPDALHLADVLEAVRHGKPVLVEKPMAMNADEARQMVEAARAAKVYAGRRPRHALRGERALVSRAHCLGGHRQAGAGARRIRRAPGDAAPAPGSTIPSSPPEARWPTSACIASTLCVTCWGTKCRP